LTRTRGNVVDLEIVDTLIGVESRQGWRRKVARAGFDSTYRAGALRQCCRGSEQHSRAQDNCEYQRRRGAAETQCEAIAFRKR
jgi:hypothetical protein